MANTEFRTGIVLFNPGSFGGAPKRFTNLFKYFAEKYPGRFYYFVDGSLYNTLKNLYPELDYDYVVRVGKEGRENKQLTSKPSFYEGRTPDIEELDKSTSYARKIFWYWKNKLKQKTLYKEIERHRKKLDIKILHGVFSGVLPLVFYLNEEPRKACVVFTDMDSWFTDVVRNTKKFWYRKYYSFNYALENADSVDFLSPFVKEGVKKLGVKLNEEKVSVTPNSFTDYSKCVVGKKKSFEIAFAARLEPDKNPMSYLEAANQILGKYPNVKFHLLGEGSLVNEVDNFIAGNNLTEKINFQFHKNPPEIFSETSIFISLQATNNYPSQSVLEAMACGNAVIATDVGDTRMLVNESNGVLINLSGYELYNAIERLINDRDLTAKLGMNARELVLREHTVEKCGDYFLSLYDKTYRRVLNK